MGTSALARPCHTRGMSKKSRRKQRRTTSTFYMPQPRPRPFAGLANELEFAAMRELLPAASLKLTLSREGREDREVTFVTACPSSVQGMVRSDGVVMVALQTRARTQDASHDLGLVVSRLLDAEAGTVIDGLDLRQRAPRLQEVIGDASGDMTVHTDLGFWLAEADKTPEALEAINRSADEMVACEAVAGQRATYLCHMDPDFLRIVLPDEEDAVFDGLARLKARDALSIPGRAHFIGAFRLFGLVAPVWEYDVAVEGADIADEVAALRERLDEAIADTQPLSVDARHARQGIVSRQLSLR